MQHSVSAIRAHAGISESLKFLHDRAIILTGPDQGFVGLGLGRPSRQRYVGDDIASPPSTVRNVTSLFHATSQSTMIRKGFCPYGPSKAALEAATAIWSKDLADTGITVNAILPGGPSDTRQVPVADVPDRTKLLPTFSMNAVALWLSTHEARGVTGRRIITSRWDSAIPPMEAVKMSSEAAGWEDRLDPDQLIV